MSSVVSLDCGAAQENPVPVKGPNLELGQNNSTEGLRQERKNEIIAEFYKKAKTGIEETSYKLEKRNICLPKAFIDQWS